MTPQQRQVAVEVARAIWRCSHYGWPRLAPPTQVGTGRTTEHPTSPAGGAKLLEHRVTLMGGDVLHIKCSPSDLMNAMTHLPRTDRHALEDYLRQDPQQPRGGSSAGNAPLPTESQLEIWAVIAPHLCLTS